MTTAQFVSVWDEAVSHLKHAARAAENVPDLAPEARVSLRNSLLVAVDVLDLARKSNRLAIMAVTDRRESPDRRNPEP